MSQKPSNTGLEKNDGPRLEMRCGRCRKRIDWFPEVARRNLKWLQKSGGAKGRVIRVLCPDPACLHENLFRIPAQRVDGPFGSKL